MWVSSIIFTMGSYPHGPAVRCLLSAGLVSLATLVVSVAGIAFGSSGVVSYSKVAITTIGGSWALFFGWSWWTTVRRDNELRRR